MTIHKSVYFALIVTALLALAACDDEPGTALSPSTVTLPPASVTNLHIVAGQTVFVPAYSEIFYTSEQDTIELTVTLAIHNTDPANAIIIQSVQYFDTHGTLVRNYIDTPVQVPPMATTGFVVQDRDTSGGWGANFLVEWGAPLPVYEPVIEAVMVSTRGTQGISMISPGRVVSEIAGSGADD